MNDVCEKEIMFFKGNFDNLIFDLDLLENIICKFYEIVLVIRLFKRIERY